MSIVSLTNISKTYKNGRGVKNLSLKIEKGQIYGLLGPNGSGKTTTMKIMVGLIHSDSGDVEIFDKNPGSDVENALQKVGCLIENPSYYPYLTAKQNLEYIRNFYPNCSSARTPHVLEQVGLSAFANEKVSNFSLGMKQRLGIAMALLSEPELLILDEPSNGLDIEGMADIREIITEQAKKGCTILISSHLANELEQICTNVAIIRDGVLLDIAKVPELLDKYGSIEKYYLTLVGARKEVAS